MSVKCIYHVARRDLLTSTSPDDPLHAQLITLYNKLKPIVLFRQANKRCCQNNTPQPGDWDIGLSNDGMRIMQENMFGPDTGAGLTAGQQRLLNSTLEMGFPRIGEHAVGDNCHPWILTLTVSSQR